MNFGTLGTGFGGLGRGGAVSSLAMTLLSGESQGLAFVASDRSMVIIDTGTPANNYAGELSVKLGNVRSGNGMRTNASGVLELVSNTLRLDYDPRLTGGPGYLIEDARTNLALRSGDLSAAASWNAFIAGSGVSPVVTQNADVAPDGTTTAARIQLDCGDTSTSTHRSLWRQTGITISNTTAYTGSIYVKARDAGNVGKTIRFSVEMSGTNAVIITLTADWQRVPVTGTSTDVTAKFLLECRGTYTTQTADFYAWGAQLEAGSFASSYIPTVGSSVTRAIDNAALATSTFPHSDTAGMLYAKAVVSNLNCVLMGLSDGTTSERHQLQIASNGRIQGIVTDGGVDQVDIIGSVDLTGLTPIKAALAYKANDCQLVQGGASIGTDVSCTMPTSDSLKFGRNPTGATLLNGWLLEGAVIPRRPTQAEMVARTA